ncbi:MAG: DUF4403 family protein [Bacteroidetes bacterium]|nr:DUF4403 family protein [Bacteroidota bacterium]
MSNAKWLLIFSIFGLLSACKSAQPAKPAEYYDTPNTEPEPSVINIPIRFYKTELLKSINDQIGDLLYEDTNMKDDGMMMRAKKRESITIDIDDQEIRYRVPVDLWVKKDLMLSDVEAEGALALEFVTRYHIKEDWSLETETELTSHKWLREPVVKLGFADLPVTAIANIVLKNIKKDFAKSIDREVKDLFNLRKQIEATWKEMHDPYLLSEEYQAWLLLNPQSIGMTPFQSNGTTVQSTIVVVTKPTIFLGEKPTSPAITKLPDFAYSIAGVDGFSLYLNTEIPFKEAERLSRQNMVGEVFSYKKKQVVVEDIKLFGQGNQLVVNTKLKGSYTGNVYLIAKPEYNANKNKIELKNVEFDFSTQKTLLKSASWLFKGPMKKQIQESLNFYLNYNLEDAKTAIRQELQNYQLAPGIQMSGLLDELSVSNVYISATAIRVRIGLKGKLSLDVKGLGQ